MKQIILALLVILVLGCVVIAQDEINPDGPSANGEATLATGFTPDPLIVEVVGGGSVRSLYVCPQNDGHTSSEPDFRLNWTSDHPQSRLMFVVLANQPAGLIIRTPEGRYFCTGNQFSTLTPPAGNYEVWVRTIVYDPDHLFSATLYITESPLDEASTDEPLTEFGGVPVMRYDTLLMASGYTPNPYTQALSGRGQNTNEFTCPGYMNFDMRQDLLWFDRNNAPLRFLYEAENPSILMVRTPDGNWSCSDAAGMAEPIIELTENRSGLYQIIVGVPSEGESVTGTLSIEEGEATPVEQEEGIRFVSNVALLNPLLVGQTSEEEAPPTFGTIDFAALNDAVVEPLAAGGTYNVETLALPEACTGYIAAAPDYRVQWTASTQMLRLAFIPSITDADTMLIVHLPDGTWLCNDDASDTVLNPALTISGSFSGAYDVWVASSRPGLIVPGGLVLSKVSGTDAESEQIRRESEMATMRFQNANQRATQYFQMLAALMKAMNEMSMGIVRNMGQEPEQVDQTLELLQASISNVLASGEVSPEVLQALNVALDSAVLTLPPEFDASAITQLRGLGDTILNTNVVVTILPTQPVEQNSQSSAELTVGSQGQVTQDGNNLNVRAEPSTSSSIMGVLVSTLCVDVVGGPVQAEGYTWWQIRGPRGIGGWVAEGSSDEKWLAVPVEPCASVSAGPDAGTASTPTLAGVVALPAIMTPTPTPIIMQVPLVSLTQLNASASPDHGDFAIVVSRFTEDPFRVQGTVAGGTVDTVFEPLPDNCVGWVTTQPDVRLDWQGLGGRLRVYFVPEGGPNSKNTTLVIRGPNGSWYCNNDSFDTFSPTVDISDLSGEFNIWVGTIGPQGEQVSGTLFVTRLEYNPANSP